VYASSSVGVGFTSTIGTNVDGGWVPARTSSVREEEGSAVEKKMSTEIGDLNGELEYNQPKFRVRVGNYFSRLEAQKDLLRLKRPFPNAILVPEKILVR